jgi:hypothetical protein
MDFGIPNNLHYNIRRSSDAYFLSVFLGIISIFFTFDSLNVLPYSFSIKIGIVVCAFGIQIIIAWLIRLGSSWIRYPLFFFAIIGFSLGGLGLVNAFLANFWIGLLGLIQLILQIYGAVILFHPKTIAWYDRNKKIFS